MRDARLCGAQGITNGPLRPRSRIAAIFTALVVCLAIASAAASALQPEGGAVDRSSVVQSGEYDPVVQGILDQVTPERLLELVSDLSGERPVWIGSPPVSRSLNSRLSFTAGGTVPYVDWAAQYVLEYYQHLGIEAEIQPYAPAYLPYYTWPNVVAEIAGTTDPNQIVILCAHLDDTAALTPDTDAPGADDNASGTAALMVAAEILSHYQFATTLRFVHFTGEEQGMWGSQAYAQRARAAGDDIIAVVNLDMIAWDAADGPVMELHANSGDPRSQTLASTFSNVVTTYSLPLSPTVKSLAQDRVSDHQSFWSNGYPAVLAIEDFGDFNLYYHKALDRVSVLNAQYFAAMTRAALATVAVYAGPLSGPEPTRTPSPAPTATLTPLPQWREYLPAVWAGHEP